MPNIFKPSSNTAAKLSLALGLVAPVLAIAIGSGLSRSPENTGQGFPLAQPVPFSHKHHAAELGIDCRYCHTSVESSAKAGIPSTDTCMSCHSQIWTNSPYLEPVRQSYEKGTPIKWTLVNKVPDFVQFNHGIHVSRGINCNNCHGAIQKMHITAKGKTLHMEWCLECHRAPEKFLYQDPKNPNLSPRQQVFNFYAKVQQNLNPATLTMPERNLLQGVEQKEGDPEVGKRLVKELGVKKAQLMDCSVCHY